MSIKYKIIIIWMIQNTHTISNVTGKANHISQFISKEKYRCHEGDEKT